MKVRFIMRKFFVVFLSVLLLSATQVLAADNSGWIVGLNDDAVMLMSNDCEYLADNIYKVESGEHASELLKTGAAKYIEPDQTVVLTGDINDLYYSSQWSLKDLKFDKLYNEGYSGKGVRVGVIDSGLNVSHEDIEGNVSEGYNYLTNSDNVEDDLGHGTIVSGIIAARTNNKIGIAGIAGNVEIIPLKAFSEKTTVMSEIIKAITDATENEKYRCDVLNMSWSLTESDSRALEEVLRKADKAGIILIAASGNYDPEEIKYPAGYDFVIGVNSIDRNMQISPFSQNNSSVFIAAPGSGISSLGIKGTDTYEHNQAGTSFAAPYISGLAAIAKQYDPSINTEKFKELLKKTSVDYGDNGYDTRYGWGVVDLESFANELKSPVANLRQGIYGVSVIDDGKNITISGESDYVNGIVMAAVYENGVLKQYNSVNRDVKWSIDIDECLLNDSLEIKCFVWTSADEMIPLGNTVIVNKKN